MSTVKLLHRDGMRDEYLQLHASQYKQKQNIHHIPYTNMQHTSTLQGLKFHFNNARYTTNIHTDPHPVTTTDIKTNIRHLHISIVTMHIATRGNKNILRTPPPHISSFEEILPTSLIAGLPNSEQINHPFSKHTYTKATPNYIHYYYAPFVTLTPTTHHVSTSPTYAPHCHAWICGHTLPERILATPHPDPTPALPSPSHPHTLTAHTHATQTTVHASQSPQQPHAQHRVLRQPHKQTKDYQRTTNTIQTHRSSSKSEINLIILQVNINGLKNKLEELKLLIHDTHADIITIQQTKLTPKAKTPKIHNFTAVRTDRLHKAGSGLITLIRDNITFPISGIPSTINTHNTELQMVKVHINNTKHITIANTSSRHHIHALQNS